MLTHRAKSARLPADDKAVSVNNKGGVPSANGAGVIEQSIYVCAILRYRGDEAAVATRTAHGHGVRSDRAERAVHTADLPCSVRGPPTGRWTPDATRRRAAR